MTAPTGTTDTDPKPAEGATGAPAEGAPPEADKDWKSEFEAQQRINRDIERRNGKRLKELEAELAASKVTKPVDDKPQAPDMDAIRRQILAETQAATLNDRALDKLEVQAAKKFQNTEDARTFLAGRIGDFIADGKVDTSAINDALTDLLKERPYLGVTQGRAGTAPKFDGTADAGPRGSAGKPQLTDADVKRMYKEGKHAEIEAARKAGQLNTLLGIK